MPDITSPLLIPILQLAISPVILISAVGLLLLTLNNRLAQSIARARLLIKERESVTGEEQAGVDYQINVITHRANLIRWSIVFIAGSALASACLIIALFISALFGFEGALFYIFFFTLSLFCLICGLILFIWEMNDALVALHLELYIHKINHKQKITIK